MSDIADFLLARIAEDETVARDATRAPWLLDEPGCCIYTPALRTSTVALFREEVVSEGDYGGCLPEKNARHIARHDPARVLAECEAKRRIVELHREERDYYDRSLWNEKCSICVAFRGDDECEMAAFPCDTVRALALPYKAHPDFRPEWVD